MYTAIIIDPRVHQAFEIVLNNFLSNLDNRWNFIIICGNLNLSFLINLINLKFVNHKHRITLVKFNINNIHCTHYNNILMNKHFYSLIPTEMFLIFQLDTLISDVYNNVIYDFMKYDYVGAPWPENDVGNGGLSLRRKTKMLEIIERLPPDPATNEDVFFCRNNLNILYKPTADEAKKFSIEAVFYDKPFGIHKPYYFTSMDNINLLEQHIPHIKLLAHINHNHIELTQPDTNIDITTILQNYQIVVF